MKITSMLPFRRASLAATSSVALTLPAATAQPAEPPPNIVIILADDMGWNQTGFNGSTWYETPNLDRLARSGAVYTQAYAAAPICSPTRAALMTGKWPARLHLTNFIPGSSGKGRPLVTPEMQQGLPLPEVTIAERLRDRGYITGLFGKWHLAPDYNYKPGRPMDPESQGFDVVFHTRKPSAKNADKPDAHNVAAITDHALEFMRGNKDRPFFCYIAHNVVHTPLTEQPALVAKYANKPGAVRPENHPVMAAMIERMDAHIGRILDELDKLDLTRRTLIVFASDNGNVMSLQSQTPFRGGKATVWQGGLRVPACVSWAGVIPAGARFDTPVITQDLFFTLTEAAGCDTSDVPADGMSLLAQLRSGMPLAARPLFWHFPHYHSLGEYHPASAIRDGNHMLIEWHEGALLGIGPAASLFDLSADEGQERDIAAENQALVLKLRAKLAQWQRDIDAQEMTVSPKAAAVLSSNPKK
ncbi:hypothetical protein AW736_05600 [Termitidicoccus mucosus]|uniref:Sulfatase N-terminal domain-containing protein n=2 Tax=Termitidicoccus mucosus TaxID=1184151 RepID=A0A178IM42_9BACT|nr:hypothetical protein AW736_05600 [Opitutaceae bacterium TSB47]